jgi:hypothetical protein
MNHLNEDDLVLHFYGELDGDAGAKTGAHLSECADCRARFVRLQRVLAAVDSAPEPVLPEGFERITWARLEPALQKRGWQAWFGFPFTRLALVAGVLVLVAGAFFAGRMTQAPSEQQTVANEQQFRELVLLSALGEHLDRSQVMLVDLVNADADASVDMASERQRAEELVAANRLYRQTAEESGDTTVTEFLDELERLLVDLAASPDKLSADDLEHVRQRIDTNNLLFKVRVVSSAVRERQKQQVRQRTGRSS